MSTAAERKITELRGDGVTLTAASEEYLSTARVANPNTHRAHASAIDHTIAQLGGGTRRPTSPTMRSATRSPHYGASANPRRGTATEPQSPPG
ncbi:hypothetical protein [Nonomuraea longicatena]|uniref:Uncharacterized protein n=1 Tax=Nonomuraea longicatena TaxID=83682 RepID=A0ABN1Q5V6_9ACTN